MRPADALSLAATPTFAIMALASAASGGPSSVICSAGSASPLTGMTAMYLLMAAFHAAPWLRRLSSER
ncbi:hypothetical protein LRS10_00975 [Phenylobacterium sp. J426]|uniref:hypothetical protein n=1 Tax=Phenylobacterium sp. J426 TaxID=2898439 RepID=UPI002150BD49|nr:hypothetical protein [Phenylobacterium sp. J426]MCR5872891.1 hypothetical protein [Phenylobacterium sp. J426]